VAELLPEGERAAQWRITRKPARGVTLPEGERAAQWRHDAQACAWRKGGGASAGP
jgi:hypothetical protein